jgi:hypothetical protein
VLGVQHQRHVHGADAGLVGFLAVEHVQEVGGEAEPVLRLQRLQPPAARSNARRQRGRLRGEQPPCAAPTRGDVVGGGVEHPQRRDGGAERGHRVRVVGEAPHHLQHLGARGRRRRAARRGWRPAAAVRGGPVPEEVADLFEGGVAGEVVDVVPRVDQLSHLAVDVAQARLARRRPLRDPWQPFRLSRTRLRDYIFAGPARALRATEARMIASPPCPRKRRERRGPPEREGRSRGGAGERRRRGPAGAAGRDGPLRGAGAPVPGDAVPPRQRHGGRPRRGRGPGAGVVREGVLAPGHLRSRALRRVDPPHRAQPLQGLAQEPPPPRPPPPGGRPPPRPRRATIPASPWTPPRPAAPSPRPWPGSPAPQREAFLLKHVEGSPTRRWPSCWAPASRP